MARARLPATKTNLSRYERLSLICSVGALAIAILAAVVSPIATYFWFDPSTKDYAQRGLLLHSEGETVWENSYYTADYTGPKWEIGTVETLVNAGKRPIKSMDIYVGQVLRQGYSTDLKVDNRVVERIKEAPFYSVYSVSGALAPGDRLVVRFRGQRSAGVFALTEHGDRYDIIQPEPRSHESVNKSPVPSSASK